MFISWNSGQSCVCGGGGTVKTYGRIYLNGNGHWHIEAEPHILLRLRRVFERVSKGQFGTVMLANTPENSRDLEWFIQRYPLIVEDAEALASSARFHRDTITNLETILAADYKAKAHELALPLRNYQGQAVDLYLANKYLLLADDVGIGKTAVGIGSLTDPRTLPAVVVTLTHLPAQWRNELRDFAPGLKVHVVKKGTPGKPQDRGVLDADVIVLNYHKLAGWAETLGGRTKSIIFDEIQELRHNGSAKYGAALHIAQFAEFRLGLSATPIYNYGGEFWNIANILQKDCIGTHPEFMREWIIGSDQKPIIRDPKAFGSYLREQCIMLRRTRRDVGRELPDLTRVPHTIDCDARKLNEIQDSATELAKLILDRAAPKQERFTAGGQFDMVMRQATGIAKAPYVADFVRMLVDTGEQVILCGWHREVYTIWANMLKDVGIAWFTGSESVSAKEASKKAFESGMARVMFMSLRAGQGLDGLQHCCRTIVFGELDWSPGIHEQCIGRIYRDGQPDPVAAYFLIADDGADPFIADVLGVKREQVEGIRSPDRPLIQKLESGGPRVREMAEMFLTKRGKAHNGTNRIAEQQMAHQTHLLEPVLG